MPLRRVLVALLLTGLGSGVAACGGAKSSDSSQIAPLTGMAAAGSSAERNRPALFVKVENSPDARPQTGLDAADVVYEVVAEGGITRFAAVFQSTDPGEVGPIRSVRGQDPDLVAPLHGLAVFAGGIPEYVTAIRQVAQDESTSSPLGEGPPFRRSRARRPPHNLFGSAAGFWSLAKSPYDSAPDPLFHYGSPPAGAQPAHSVAVDFSPAAKVQWRWDGSAWRRSQDGRPFAVTGSGRIAPVNLIVQFVDVEQTSFVDPAGHAVPQSRLQGSGEAWLLRDGSMVRGSWSKQDQESRTRYQADGKDLSLAPGRTWVELVPTGRSVTVAP